MATNDELPSTEATEPDIKTDDTMKILLALVKNMNTGTNVATTSDIPTALPVKDEQKAEAAQPVPTTLVTIEDVESFKRKILTLCKKENTETFPSKN